VQIVFALYDKSGNRIGTAMANINHLGSGAIWKFKAVGFVPSTHFKVSELTGF
jgi:hypothetical protein